jgi:hypothetical protein
MNHRRLLVTLSAGVAVVATTLVFGSLGGCADYSSDPDAAGTGGSGAGAPPATGGQAGVPATGGSAAGGQAGTSATAGSSGDSGSGGAGVSGSGGTDQAGSAGSAGSSAGSAASCDDATDVTACGGDIVGAWTVSSACMKISGEVDLSGLGTDCKSSPVTGTLTVTGTFTVNADGTFTDETTTTGEEILDLPQTCLTLSGTVSTCARIGGPLKSVGYKKVTCVDKATGAGTGCDCVAQVEQTGGLGMVSGTPATTGNYTTADNTLSLSDGIREALYPYCVAAPTLTLSPPSMGKVGTSAGTILLQKQ